MSSRTYLFSAIAFVMVAIAAGQWFMFQYFSDDISEQVRAQSKDLSKELAVFAADAMKTDFNQLKFESVFESQQGDEQEKTIIIRSQHGTVTKEIRREDEMNVEEIEHIFHDFSSNKLPSDEQSTTTQPKITKKFEAVVHHDALQPSTSNNQNSKIEAEQIHQLVRKKIEDIEFHVDSNQEAQSVWVFQSSTNGGPVSTKRIEIQDHTSMLLNQLKQMGLVIMVVSWLLGILFVYWISHKFTAPLRALESGYQKISEGETDIHLPVKGTTEIQQVISGFNQMTQKLAFYRQQEKHVQDKIHLADIGEVSRGIAHALRNPLHTIGLALDKVFQNSPSDYEQPIRQKIKLMDKTIQNLLNISDAGVDRGQTISIKQVVQDIVMEMQLSATHKLSFKIDVPSDLYIEGSESEIRNMIHTLVVNAVEASPENGEVNIAAVNRFINSNDNENAIQISVIDQGKGVSEDIADQLFQPHITTKAEGTGMGLYIARRLARLIYHGDIRLTNQKDSESDTPLGCKATLTLSTLQSNVTANRDN